MLEHEVLQKDRSRSGVSKARCTGAQHRRAIHFDEKDKKLDFNEIFHLGGTLTLF